MGTNYYIKGWNENDAMNPNYHIGKRSAAGAYCFDCGITLCLRGEKAVHDSEDSEWSDICPICNKKSTEETFENSSVGLELGFNHNPVEKKEGVRSCSSFSWAMSKIMLHVKAAEVMFDNAKKDSSSDASHKVAGEICIVNEYDKEFTLQQFLDIVEACPIHFNCIRETFS